MQPMEIHDYINERPRRYQKGTRDANQTGNNTHNDILYILLKKFFCVCTVTWCYDPASEKFSEKLYTTSIRPRLHCALQLFW